MFKILKKTQFSEKVFEFRVHAPRMAKHAHASSSWCASTRRASASRSPLPTGTRRRVGSSSSSWSWVRRPSASLSSTKVTKSRTSPDRSAARPRIEGDRVAVVGGGVGLAIAYPVARTLCEQGKKVSVIMGARNKDLLILFEQFASLPLENLFITTDDGSMGEKGVVTLPLRRLCETDSIDSCFCVGPVPMMKFSTLTCREFKIPIVASLNPIMVDGTGMCGCCRVEVAAKPSSLRRRPGFRCEPRRLGRPRPSPGQLQGRGSRFHQAS